MNQELEQAIGHLSDYRLELLQVIRKFQENSLGRPPSYREIMAGTRYSSTSHVQNDLKELVELGLLVNVQFAMGSNRLNSDASRCYVIAGCEWQPPEWFSRIQAEQELRLAETK